ncbi:MULTISPECIES: helix-turn-helix transcriptional regulator [Winkia]|uniref:helix-turn-helix transcriptional regulator n=1 Tax=Winkia TaxID=2692118 RepID=UPI000C80E0D2|nr:helix-turn-helix domain-containing protein [Winkia neuii]NJJ14662.1 helix-turn-helix domain-containing protein [Winkia neuii]PMC93198.1 DNA-binding protein [Actinomyces sp. UMB0918]
MTRLLTTVQVAKILSCSVRTLQRWREMGTGPIWVKLENSTVRYEYNQVLDWIESQNA